jgi:hypothetical protein
METILIIPVELEYLEGLVKLAIKKVLMRLLVDI